MIECLSKSKLRPEGFVLVYSVTDSTAHLGAEAWVQATGLTTSTAVWKQRVMNALAQITFLFSVGSQTMKQDYPHLK